MEAGTRASSPSATGPTSTTPTSPTLDRRIEREIAELAADRAVRYLGSILLREDEVVLCQFEGPADSVRDVAERAEIPFERILATALAPWPLSNEGGPE